MIFILSIKYISLSILSFLDLPWIIIEYWYNKIWRKYLYLILFLFIDIQIEVYDYLNTLLSSIHLYAGYCYEYEQAQAALQDLQTNAQYQEWIQGNHIDESILHSSLLPLSK